MMFFTRKKTEMPKQEDALPGRSMPITPSMRHVILQQPLTGPFPAGSQSILFGMGCFWGAERKFWQLGEGILSTAVGYSAGFTPNPTYEEVCSGRTGHNEVVRVVFDPSRISLDKLLTTFWENHDPTQGMRQGNDTGTQYRSGIYVSDTEQFEQARASAALYQQALTRAGLSPLTTEILMAKEFYFAETDHQQYLAKNPRGYCGLGGTGVGCPVGLIDIGK